MAAVGTNLNARRAAMSHTLFNVIGVSYMLLFIYLGWFERFVDAIIPGDLTLTNVMFHIAVAHSTFNVINTLVFLPFVGILEKLSIWLVPKKGDSVDIGPQYLERHLLDTPSLALEQIHKENVYMLKVSKKAVIHAVDSFLNNDLKLAEKVNELETATDNLQSEITQYIVDLSQKNLLPEESEELPVLIHNVNDLERVGDHSQNLAELTKRKIGEQLIFTDDAIQEIRLLWLEIQGMFEDAHTALTNNDTEIAKRMLEREKKINQFQVEFKQKHIQRLNDGKCQLNSGFVFLEFIDNLEKVGDRLTNIAHSVIHKMKWRAEKTKISKEEVN
ncbi:MAG: Na/Pi cotransporter family protein [Candidatus Omnitrophica bacterium]|nr:Na/Pi cotransporter family protein [Candidatus Omnitrophota bacterium]